MVRTWTRCPLCARAADGAEVFVRFAEKLAFVRCGCGAVYKQFEAENLLPADFYEAGYFHGRKSGRDKRFEHRVRKAKAWIRAALEFAPAGASSLLDVGCSFGYVVEAGRRLGLSAAGVDVSAYAVEKCREKGLTAEVDTLEKTPFADASFDVVVMKHVLEHTPDPRAALKEVARITRPGAALLVAVPDLDYWKGQRRRESYRYFRPDDLGAQHYVYYSRQTLPRLLGECGFAPAATSKALFRRKLAARSPAHALWESVRFAGLSAGVAVAKAFSLQRELFVIARKAQPTP